MEWFKLISHDSDLLITVDKLLGKGTQGTTVVRRGSNAFCKSIKKRLEELKYPAKLSVVSNPKGGFNPLELYEQPGSDEGTYIELGPEKINLYTTKFNFDTCKTNITEVSYERKDLPDIVKSLEHTLEILRRAIADGY